MPPAGFEPATLGLKDAHMQDNYRRYGRLESSSRRLEQVRIAEFGTGTHLGTRVRESSSIAHRCPALPFDAMTAKEQLRQRVEAFSEQEAVEALRLLDLRNDPVVVAFRDAPVDDELFTEEDEAALAEARADIAAGHTVSLDEAMRELE